MRSLNLPDYEHDAIVREDTKGSELGVGLSDMYPIMLTPISVRARLNDTDFQLSRLAWPFFLPDLWCPRFDDNPNGLAP